MREFSEEDLEGEIWEYLIGFEDYCEISTLGRFKSKRTNSVYKLGLYPNGYEQFSIYYDGRKHTAIAHRLVAKQFLPNPNNLPVVNHKNGMRNDNRVENLEWCSQSDNLRHSFRELGRETRDMRGTNNANSTLTEKDVLEIRNLFITTDKTNIEIAKLYGVQPACISKIAVGRSWKHLL